MKLNHKQRLWIAHEIQRQLPWASVVAGAPRYNFLHISRGEQIVGTHINPDPKGAYRGSAWHRPMPGSYEIHVELGEGWAEVRRQMQPKPRETERMLVVKRHPTPYPPGEWTGQDRLRAIADWLVSLSVQSIPEASQDKALLGKGERFEVRVNRFQESTAGA